MEQNKYNARLTAELFFTMAKIGLFTFGGGYAMISLIESICVEKRNWITQDEMMNMTVIAESTPGPIAINCATFVGFKQCGFRGALAATLGMILPSFCILFVISTFLEHFLAITWIANAFRGIKIAVGILILDAALKMLKKMRKKTLPCLIMLAAFVSILVINFLSLKVSTVLLMLAAGVISLMVYVVRSASGNGGDSV